MESFSKTILVGFSPNFFKCYVFQIERSENIPFDHSSVIMGNLPLNVPERSETSCYI